MDGAILQGRIVTLVTPVRGRSTNTSSKTPYNTNLHLSKMTSSAQPYFTNAHRIRRARARSLHPLACPSAFLWLVLQQSGEAPHMQVPISDHRVRAYTVKEYNDTNVKPRRRTHAQSTPCPIDATPNQRHARRSKPTKPWRGTKWGTRVLSRLTPLTSSWVEHRGQDGARDGSQSQRSTQCT